MRHFISPLIVLAMLFGIVGSGFGQDRPPGAEPVGHGLAKFFFDVPSPPFEAARLAGLPAGSKPDALTWQSAYGLALIRARNPKPPRFATLDANQLADGFRGVGVEDFARFRKDFLTSRTFHDPAAELLGLQAELLKREILRGNLVYNERCVSTLKSLFGGEGTGLERKGFDSAAASLAKAQRDLARATADYRDRLDTLKVDLGISLHAAVVVDSSTLGLFQEVFEEAQRWLLSPQRELAALDRISDRLPAVGDVVIEGRSVLAEVDREPDRLEEVLAMATRVALANRREQDESNDSMELRVRRQLRRLAEIRVDYENERRISMLAVRDLDTAFEQILSPPAGALPPADQDRTQILLTFVGPIRQVAESRSRLVGLWTEFRATRLGFYRDLGVLPFENWSSFYGQFNALPSPP